MREFHSSVSQLTHQPIIFKKFLCPHVFLLGVKKPHLDCQMCRRLRLDDSLVHLADENVGPNPTSNHEPDVPEHWPTPREISCDEEDER